MLVQVEANDQQARERERLTQPKLAILEASIDSLKKQQVALVDEKTHIVQENEALRKEHDKLLLCISALKK
jgi:regulator of replication initiation timing